jgi:uncharacterized protein
MSGEIPSPCIDVCKHKLRGHCIGCSMTEAQKREFETLRDNATRLAFIQRLLTQQVALGDRFRGWPGAYRRKCEMAGVESPV